MTHKVGYTKRICDDPVKIGALLTETRTGILGLSDDGDPYAVPVNFVWHKDCIYFHGMGSGRKVSLLAKAPPVCFTVFKEYGTVTDAVPCHADTAYLSVMIFGRAVKVSDPEEAALVLQTLLGKYMPGYYTQTIGRTLVEKYRSSLDGNGVAVYRIIPEEITAKENTASPDILFHAGS